jgi:iron complex transport system substrate-binding protein
VTGALGVFLVAAAAAFPRVFSADFCADQMVLALADESQIAALSPDAEKDFSYHRARAAGLPQRRAGAEEVAASGAEIVLRYWGGDAPRLARLGARVVTLAYAADFDAVAANIRVAADALGRKERGAALIAALDQRRAALAERGPTGRTALYVTPGGVSAGDDTMIAAIFAAAGVGNALSGRSGWPATPLESLARAPPEIAVAGFFNAASARADNWSAARHPAFARIFAGGEAIFLAPDVIACPGNFAIEAAETIRRALDAGEGAADDR